MAAPTSISSQGTQTYQSSPMAFTVNTVSPVAEQVQTANVETEEEKMDRKWLDLLNHQMNFCLGLIAHATTSRCVNEVIKANVLAHLGRVMGDAKKSYEGFREICVTLRQTPFTVPPGFAKVEYKFTDVQTAKKPKQAATAKTTTAAVSQSDQQPSQVDYQALLQEHQLAQQNITLEEQLTQQMDFQPNFDDLFNGI